MKLDQYKNQIFTFSIKESDHSTTLLKFENNFIFDQLHSKSNSICALKFTSKSLFIKNYIDCLKNRQIPFAIAENVSIEDMKLFAEKMDATNLKCDDLNYQGDYTSKNKEISPLIPMGHISCSSGTTSKTGKIKSYRFSIEKIINNGLDHYRSLEISGTQNICFPLPFYHSFGLTIGLVATVTMGHNLYTYNYTPSNEELVSDLEDNKIDLLYLTPSLVRLLNKYLKRKKIKNDRKFKISIGAAHLYKSDLEQLRTSFPNAEIYYTYGLSELGPRVSTYKYSDDYNQEILPIGKPINEKIIFKIQGPYLLVKSPYLFDESNTDLTNLLDDQGFYNTMDMTEENTQDNITIKGRSSYMINYGGVSLFSEEIESFLNDSLNKNFYISKRNNQLYGEVPIIVIEEDISHLSNDEIDKLKNEILEITSKHIPPNISIVDVEFKSEFKRTSMGKIVR